MGNLYNWILGTLFLVIAVTIVVGACSGVPGTGAIESLGLLVLESLCGSS